MITDKTAGTCHDNFVHELPPQLTKFCESFLVGLFAKENPLIACCDCLPTCSHDRDDRCGLPHSSRPILFTVPSRTCLGHLSSGLLTAKGPIIRIFIAVVRCISIRLVSTIEIPIC